MARHRRIRYLTIATVLAVALTGGTLAFAGHVNNDPISGRPLVSAPTSEFLTDLPAGTDRMETIAEVIIELAPCSTATGNVPALHVAGDTVVQRGDAQPEPSDGDRHHIPTEIISMELTSTDPFTGDPFVIIRESPTQQSEGAIFEQNATPNGEFPAESFFDVFVEIEVPLLGLTLHNNTPIEMNTTIFDLPPIGAAYEGPPFGPIDLFDGATPVACLFHVQHVPTTPSIFKVKKEIIELFNLEFDTNFLAFLTFLEVTQLGAFECVFADGATHSGITTFLTILNRNTVGVNYQVTYFFKNPSNTTKVITNQLIGAESRDTRSVNNDVSPVKDDVSILIEADGPLVVERTMTFPSKQGATSSSGDCASLAGFFGPSGPESSSDNFRGQPAARDELLERLGR